MGRDLTQKMIRNTMIACLLGLFVLAGCTGNGHKRQTVIESAGAREEVRPGSEAQTEDNLSREYDQTENETQKDDLDGKKQPPQSDSGEGQEESRESAAPGQTKQTLDLAQIRAMEAGSILDITKIEEGLADQLFYSEEIQEDVRQRILGVSYQENDTISLEELRYLRVLHIGFDGQTHIGELLVNQSIAEDVQEIMKELYQNQYPIEKMVLVDAYGADDETSMSDNNTSAFNYREIAGTSRMSRHSLGLAIDINPKYNPYVKQESNGEISVSPANGADYADRNKEFKYKINENDLCCRLFAEHGFAWGGNWKSVKDYQHFEK